MFDWEKFDKKINKYACNQLIMLIEEFDEKFFNNYDKTKLKNIARRTRKQLTTYGEIEVKRRKYENKTTGKIITPVDYWFGFVKNSNINYSLWKKIYNEVDSGSTIGEIKKIIPNAKISHASISSILSAEKPIIKSPEIVKKK